MQKLINQSRLILKYLIASMLLAVPLYPKFPFLRLPHTYVSIRIEDFLIALIGILVLIILIPKIKEIFQKDIERRIMIFLFAGFVSLISGIFLTKTVIPTIGILHWLRRIEYLIPFFAAIIVIQSDRKDMVQFVIKILLVDLFILFIYGLGQMYLSWPVIVTQNEEYSKGIALRWVPGGHINSTFAGHYDLASFLVVVLPIFINIFILIREKWTKILFGLAIMGGYWLISAAVSRISIVSFMFAVCCSFIILKRYKLIPVFVLVSLIIFGLSPDLRSRYERVFQITRLQIQKLISINLGKTIYASSETIIPSVSPKRRSGYSLPTPTPIPVFEDRSSSIRFVVEWPRAIRALSKNPLVGTGYSSITLATDNDYLRLLGETGILGFLSFSLIILSVIILFWKSILKIQVYDNIEKAFLAGMMGGFMGILINAIFIDIFEASKFAMIFWFMLGLVVFLLRNNIYEENN